LPTYAKIENLDNGKEVIVKINDRGPFVKDRLIDLSYAAAKKLGFHAKGIGKVKITAIDPVVWQKQEQIRMAKQNPAKAKAKPIQLAKQNPAKPKPTAKNPKQIYIQLGAFSNKANAQQLAKKASTLTQALNQVNINVLPSSLHNKSAYKVRVGPLKNEQEAHKLQKKLVALQTKSVPKVIYE
jgi:rare lipoprotein A